MEKNSIEGKWDSQSSRRRRRTTKYCSINRVYKEGIPQTLFGHATFDWNQYFFSWSPVIKNQIEV